MPGKAENHSQQSTLPAQAKLLMSFEDLDKTKSWTAAVTAGSSFVLNVDLAFSSNNLPFSLNN